MNELLTLIKPHPSKKISDSIRGKDGYIDMTVGMPHFGPSKKILGILKKIAHESLQETCSEINKYADSKGLYCLREEIAKRYLQKYAINLNPNEEIIITNGCAEAIWLTIFTATSIGDEIIIPDPCYMLYEPIIISLGRHPVRVETSVVDNFILHPSSVLKKITAKTKLIIINSPANPTGTVYPEDVLKELCEIAEKKNIYLMHDEVFDDFIFGEVTHTPIIQFSHISANLIMVNSFSKRFGITGWRLGWLIATKKFMSQVLKAHTFNCLAVNRMAQKVIAHAVNDKEVIDDVKLNTSNMLCNLKKFATELERIEGFIFKNLPDGGMYLFPEVSGLFKRISRSFKDESISESVSKFVLEKCQIAFVPGVAFGNVGGAHVRISIAGEEQLLFEAIDRLRRFFY